jgi:hypothetical protein
MSEMPMMNGPIYPHADLIAHNARLTLGEAARTADELTDWLQMLGIPIDDSYLIYRRRL